MGKSFSLLILAGFCTCGIFSCDDKTEDQKPWISRQAKLVMDSIGTANIMACFADGESFSVLVAEPGKSANARKLTYRKGFAVFTDSLLYQKYDELRSRRFHTTYLIKDTAVLLINYVKIIHPSSNWQGQTPWQQPYINIYRRLDRGN